MSLEFNLARKSEVVMITLSDGETQKKYTLKEFSGKQRAEYMKQFDMNFEFVDGKTVVKASEGFQPMTAEQFITLCLYNDQDKLVTLEEVLTYPATVINGLHNAGRKLSGLGDEEKIKAKNDSEVSDSTGTS